jgi:hypothetical protein
MPLVSASPLKHLHLATSGGGFSFVGSLRTEPDRANLVVVCGAFTPPGYMHDLVADIPDRTVQIVLQPGWAAPWIRDLTPADMGRGFREALLRLYDDRPVVLAALSAGNLVTLDVDLPNIRRRVVVEPFFRTEPLWPFIEWSRDYLKATPDAWAARDYLWNVFGVTEDRLEDRDYRRLVDNIRVPTDVLVSPEPLSPRRPTPPWPSLTSAEDRALLAANPHVTLHDGPPGSGHDITDAGYRQLVNLCKDALAAADGAA